ncbi:hypothetical protein LTR37_013284 [Vermiconidia calcicola]|uniref:Uncharacterized protein n=1 Tax=Vermiconidia calcicola TaxID=1690605 RepID=A0ACC3MY29_9PEZI|nr:hypothetical protein LTR37_013284 [Vermiconidia calcicola]
MATLPEPNQGDYHISNFRFVEGTSLPDLRIHYHTIGKLREDSHGKATNAVLIMHGTTGNGANFLNDIFAGKLFKPGQLLSAEEYFLVLPDAIGHGKSSKPSDGLRATFPRYSYADMVRAQHLLLTEHLGVNHLRLVMGTSMGGMYAILLLDLRHSWVWGTRYPGFMDAIMPLASLPSQISGRNRMMRKMAIDSIRDDPQFDNGNYETQPRGLRAALHILAWMSSSPLQWQNQAPDRESADKFIDAWMDAGMRQQDANDFAFAFDASRDYDPRPGLKDISAPLIAVDFEDDQANLPELQILETEIKKVKQGKAVVVPISAGSAGHGTHTVAAVWKDYLAELLETSKVTYSVKL